MVKVSFSSKDEVLKASIVLCLSLFVTAFSLPKKPPGMADNKFFHEQNDGNE